MLGKVSHNSTTGFQVIIADGKPPGKLDAASTADLQISRNIETYWEFEVLQVS
jgi:hypothetical protein